MQYTFPLPSGLAAIYLLAITSTIKAHTWVEDLQLITSNGSYTGATGYIRGFGPRLPNINPDAVNVHELPGTTAGNAFLASDNICKDSQNNPVQTSGYPRLTAAPQDQIALRYLENGHVTLFASKAGKPLGRGTVFIYGTKQSSPDDKYLSIHRVWNEAGTGGDKRGKLLATRPFDDGRCFQQQRPVSNLTQIRMTAINWTGDDGDLQCQTALQLPTDAGTSGTYSLYWVWEWPTLAINGAVLTNESYTSCMDINMISTPVAPAGKFAAKEITGVAAQSVALLNQLETAFEISPTATPKIASDNLPVGGPTAPVPAPAPAPAATSAVKSSASSAPAGFITVTVTAHEISTALVTITQAAPTHSSIPAVSPSNPVSTPLLITSSIQTTTTSTIMKTVVAPKSSTTSLSSVVTVPLVLSQPPTITGFLPVSTGVTNTTSKHARLRARRIRL